MQYQSKVDTAINVTFDQNTYETLFFFFFVSLCTVVCCSVGTIPTVVLRIRLYSIRCENTLYCSTRLFRAIFYKRECRVHKNDRRQCGIREVTLYNEFDAKKNAETDSMHITSKVLGT